MKTISDAAEELGVNKTTVSRALSGRGRVGEETRKRVLDWAKANNFTPNSIARSLAAQKSYNIGVVLPESSDNVFFQQCFLGITYAVEVFGYDALAVIDREDNIMPLERVVKNRKVDALIVTRLMENDKTVSFLKSSEIPFIVIGTSSDGSLFTVDAPHRDASCSMTKYAIETGAKNIVLLLGGEQYFVNKQRYYGFLDAHNAAGMEADENRIFWNVWTSSADDVGKILSELDDVDCIACGDEAICSRVIEYLRLKKADSKALRLFSFYDGVGLSAKDFPASAVVIDNIALGKKAGENIISLLQKKSFLKNDTVSYDLKIR